MSIKKYDQLNLNPQSPLFNKLDFKSSIRCVIVDCVIGSVHQYAYCWKTLVNSDDTLMPDRAEERLTLLIDTQDPDKAWVLGETAGHEGDYPAERQFIAQHPTDFYHK